MLRFEYSRSDPSPNLFSETRDLEFSSPDARLVHDVLKAGPKGFTVVSVSSTGHSAGFVEHYRTAVTLPLVGHANVQVGDRSFSVRPGDMVALGPSERSSTLTQDEEVGVYRSFTVISPPRWPYGLPEHALYRTPDPKRLKLLELLRFSFSYRADPELVSDRTVLLHEALVEDALIEALTPSTSRKGPTPHQSRYESVVRKAERFIEEHFSDALSMPDMASKIGVPVKTLQRAFKARRGVTLRSHIASVRLDAMQRALERGGETSVTTAALDSGLLHLGRASAAYLHRFGERPSETLERRRN